MRAGLGLLIETQMVNSVIKNSLWNYSKRPLGFTTRFHAFCEDTFVLAEIHEMGLSVLAVLIAAGNHTT